MPESDLANLRSSAGMCVVNNNHALQPLGWNLFFEKQLTAEESSNYIAARVIAVHKYAFTLSDGLGSLAAVVSGKSLQAAEHHPELPVVGDWVLAKPPVGGTAVIIRRLERRSALARRRPSDRNAFKASVESQVLASNLDYVFVVMSLNQDLNPARLERALTLVWNSGATPVVLLSKADLCADSEVKILEMQAISGGAQVHALSSLQGQGLQAVRNYLKTGVTGCLLGSSGAGKTTLLNALCGTEYKTLSIRSDDDKGRHATTARALFFLPAGGMIVDTPGLREIGLLDDFDLSAAFTDVAGFAKSCRFADCTHRVEPACGVLAALNEGRLPQERYDNYLKLTRELEFQTGKHSISQSQAAKKKAKQMGKIRKDYREKYAKHKRD
jgi:ribosome biogenesis GTPase / thiamine phosphate phosphatase